MLFQKPRSIASYVKQQELLTRILESTATAHPKAFPVFECVKVWCKLGTGNVVLFARTKDDVLAGGRLPTEVVSKFKSNEENNHHFN